MNATIELLTGYGYVAVFACVLAEQLGLPFPATPVLLAAGALAGLGKLSLPLVWLLAVLASLIGDTVWYYLGRTKGTPVLRMLCRISLEPDICVRRTHSSYSRHGDRWLLFAKFIPGVSTIAPPMAGIYGVSPGRFVAMDGVGAGLWAGVFIVAGWCFRNQTDAIASFLTRLGGWVGFTAVCALPIYILFRFLERQRVYRSLRLTRIGPLELKQRMDSGAGITIVDLREAFDRRDGKIPGSLIFSEAQLDALDPAMVGSEVVLYCSCPNDISSAARTALRLQRRGVRVIRPLEGGFPLWMRMGLPVEVPSNATAGVRQREEVLA